MDKKGFTLIELLAVLVILAIISLVAVPNVVNMVEKNKKKQMVLDAKEMLNKYKNYETLNLLEKKCSTNITCLIEELGLEGKTDGFGDAYSKTSYITYGRTGYKIILETDNHCLGIETCGDFTTKNSEDFNPTVDNILEK